MFKPKSNNPMITMALPIEDCFAKTYIENNTIYLGRSVEEHCKITGKIAESIISIYPQHICEEFFPDGSNLIAAIHDIGKISPTFQEKLRRATPDYKNNSLPELSKVDPNIETEWGGHAYISKAMLEKTNDYVSKIAGVHHGNLYPAQNKDIHELFGGENWNNERLKFFDLLKNYFDIELPKIKDDLHANVLAGLTVVSDWTASSQSFDDPKQNWENLIESVVIQSGFAKPKYKENLKFEDIFPFSPNNIQKKLFHACENRGVYILEAPMGIGKTEAALYVAYKMVSSGQATGIYFGLPTKLTSDKIYSRMNEFIQNIISDDSPHKNSLLLHSSAKTSIMGEEVNPGNSWFNSSKRGIIAPFAVGTLDQALMSVINVKHNFVRTFGLLGKVVILDEVHAYDSYTGTILDTLVRELLKLKCTVIILSATLTQSKRNAMLSAESKELSYPLITAIPDKSKIKELSFTSSNNVDVNIVKQSDDNVAINEAVKRADNGEQVLWIENTVSKAQEIYKMLVTSGIDVGLLHSRFIKKDRLALENKWTALYGKNSAERNKKGRILIGTQVLEQSIDIDADFLITRIAPVDMLLQRIGRLWRHEKTERPTGAKRQTWVLMPDKLSHSKENDFGTNNVKVYSAYVLYRTYEQIVNLEKITIPKDIRRIIEDTYAERSDELWLNKYKKELEAEKSKLERFARMALSDFGSPLPDERVHTRYGEIEQVIVLLIKDLIVVGKDIEITFLDGETVTLYNGAKSDMKNRRGTAMKLDMNSVQVAEYNAPVKLKENNIINCLKNYVYMGEDKSSYRIGIVDNLNMVTDCKKETKYSAKTGYSVKK